jgi:predicted metalloprotease with PDZ domain
LFRDRGAVPGESGGPAVSEPPSFSLERTLTAPLDLGDVPIVQSRLGTAKKGDLGTTVAQGKITAASGPAAAAGLRVGDVVASIDGITGEPLAKCARTLLAVPVGTVVKIALASGKTVSVTAVPRTD